MTASLYQVDAFADEPFSGNPAAVCLLDNMPEETWLQNIAAEMNLSETAFVVPQHPGYRLRWFTPTVEVDLCGHATLAAAHVLREAELAGSDDNIRFFTASGDLIASFDGEDVLLDFPATPATQCDADPGLAQPLGVEPLFQGRNDLDYLVEVADESSVRNCHPDFAALAQCGMRGVMVTAKSEQSEYDFISRYFAPGAGINEDPVTGSAHCTLAPYWQSKLDCDELRGYQASQRGGVVRTVVRGDRIELRGRAVTVLRGQLLV